MSVAAGRPNSNIRQRGRFPGRGRVSVSRHTAVEGSMGKKRVDPHPEDARREPSSQSLIRARRARKMPGAMMYV